MNPFTLLGQILLGKFPFCSLIGGTVGVIAGSFLGLTIDTFPAGALTTPQIVQAGLMLAIAGWIAVLFMFGLWLRYGLAQLWLPAAINAVITAILTVWVNNKIHLAAWAPILGLLVGLLVGLILCRLCPRWARGTGSVTHAR